MIERIIIENYKSIREMDIRLGPINVLIGGNGAGKSNFISFFKLVKEVYEGNIRSFSLKKGANNLLYRGVKHSDHLLGSLDFDNTIRYQFQLFASTEQSLFVAHESVYWNKDETSEKNYEKWHWAPDKKDLNGYLNSFRVYHFHDTSETAALKAIGQIDDNALLREDGSNLSAYLFLLKEKYPKNFNRIEMAVRSIAPFFERFDLKPRNLDPNQIKLEWKEVDSDMYLDAHQLSDGTLRFIALATLLLQPNPPKTIIIDEPELGLHPFAIHKLAGLVKKASHGSQIIISTQSVELVNQFEAQEVVTVDRTDGQSVFQYLNGENLKGWLEEFSLGDIWQKNIIGGQP